MAKRRSHSRRAHSSHEGEHSEAAGHHRPHRPKRNNQPIYILGAVAMFLLGLTVGLLAFYLFTGEDEANNAPKGPTRKAEWDAVQKYSQNRVTLRPWLSDITFHDEKGTKTAEWTLSLSKWNFLDKDNHRLYKRRAQTLGTITFPKPATTKARATAPRPTRQNTNATSPAQPSATDNANQTPDDQAQSPANANRADSNDGDYSRKEMVQVDQPAGSQTSRRQTSDDQDQSPADANGADSSDGDYSRQEMVQVDQPDGSQTSRRQTTDKASDSAAPSPSPAQATGDMPRQQDRAADVLRELTRQVEEALPNVVATAPKPMTVGQGAVAYVNLPAGMITLVATPAGPDRVAVAYNAILLSRPLREADIQTIKTGGKQSD